MSYSTKNNLKNIFKCLYIILITAAVTIGSTGSYFSDTATISNNIITTGENELPELQVLINEVYYDTGCRIFNDNDCSRFEREDDNEWVELYNPTGVAISLKKWSISGDSWPSIINSNVEIPAYGFALLSHGNDTWHFWENITEDNVVKINLSGSHDRMSNSGDRVILRDDKGDIVDQISYGDDTEIFDPACIDVDEGHSLEREHLGTDSDTSADFIERIDPTPGY